MRAFARGGARGALPGQFRNGEACERVPVAGALPGQVRVASGRHPGFGGLSEGGGGLESGGVMIGKVKERYC